MKKLLLVVISMLCVGTVFAAVNMEGVTSQTLREKYTSETINSGLNTFWLMYADYMETPENYTTFTTLTKGIDSHVNDQEKIGQEHYYNYLYYIIIGEPSMGLSKYAKDAYEHAVANKFYLSQVKYFLSRDEFCEDNEIDDEARFNLIAKNIMHFRKEETSQVKNACVKLSDVCYAVEDDIAIKAYTRLYRKFYQRLSLDSEDQTVKDIVTQLAMALKSYGVDVNK